MHGPQPADDSFDQVWAIRDAVPDDVARICAFGATHVGPHYAPLIGDEAADQQVTRWWSASHIASAVDDSLVVIAEAGGVIVGVAERGVLGERHVLSKLYLDPAHRGVGLGPALIDAVARRLPASAERLYVEHFAGNTRAAAFYEREGFVVERVDRSDRNSALDVVWRARTL